jgi:hypothetical protein
MTALVHDSVGQGSLAVVDVGDDGYVAYFHVFLDEVTLKHKIKKCATVERRAM